MPAQERHHELVVAPRERAAEHAELHGPAAQLVQLVDAVGGVLDRAQAPGRVLGKCAACLRGHDPAARAHEQGRGERLLELADLLRDCGLRHAQLLGGGRERAQLDRGAEAADLLQRQKLCL
jgi:hypothetical protein